MLKITPFLWFDSNAEEVVKFYTSVFSDSKVGGTSHYEEGFAEASGQPVGSIMTIDFELLGKQIVAMNAGPMFKFTPSTSFFVQCKTEEEADKIWSQLADGGMVMMEYQQYPFATKYGWLSDRFGVSWQVIVCGVPMNISESLMFVKDKAGLTEEAINFYVSVFSKAPGEGWADSKIEDLARYEEGEGDTTGFIKHGAFKLAGQSFKAMGSSYDHKFDFSQAFSFVINCETQEEVDYFWEQLSAGGEEQPCGWLLDKYGVAWQVVPTVIPKLMMDPDLDKRRRGVQAIMKMKKIDIQKLEEA